ncbi:MAG: histone deacetylase family protein [Cyanobacteriota bacterium]|jgi:acetoin utilization deacetylase AcuC-like enzyme
MVTLFYSPEFLNHDTGAFHPESPARLTAIEAALKKKPWANYLHWRTPPAPESRNILYWLKQVHAPEYLQALEQMTLRGGGALDSDTPVSAESYPVALLAASAWLDGVDQALREPVFVLSRPPGHHALRERGMGFCLLNNAAVAARYALSLDGVERVGIVDWDVHHGNGTEALVADNPQIFYCSLHQYPFYPGSGAAQERGLHDNILNIPLRAGSGLAEYEDAFQSQVLPFFQSANPDLLIVSAGYDANRDDPLAGMNLVPQDYGVLTHHLLTLKRPLLFGLEGGYDLPSLGQSVAATLAALLD